MRKLLWFVLAALSVAGAAAALTVTGLRLSDDQVKVSWDSSSGSHVVMASTNLMGVGGGLRFVGEVVTATNMASLPATSFPSTCFFAVSEVHVVSFPDPGLEAAVRAAVPPFPPTNRLYDFQVGALTSLDASCRGITNLAGLSNLASLVSLNLTGNSLSSIDVSSVPTLRRLNCASNPMPGDVTFDEASLEDLDVSGCGMSSLYCVGLSLTNLAARGCLQITEVQCEQNSLSRLDVSGCPSLTSVHCWQNQISSLSLAGSLAIWWLDVSDNKMVDLQELVDNSAAGGLGPGDMVYLLENPLGANAIDVQIPALEAAGATVFR